MKKLLSFLILFSLFTSCEEIVEMDIPPVEEVTVAFATQATGEPFKMYISKSQHIYDTANAPKSDSTVEAYVVCNNQTTKLRYIKGWFEAMGFKANHGDSVHLLINHDRRKTASANIAVPIDIVNHSIEVTPSAMMIEDLYYSKVLLNFTDPAEETNYYELKLWVTRYFENSTETSSWYEFRSFDPVMVNEDIMQYEPGTMLFNDEMFNGKSLSIPMYYFINFQWGDPKRISVISELRNISKEHYSYYKTLYRNLYNEGGIWGGMTTPVQVQGNIKNGAGLFSVFTATYDTITYDLK